MLRRIKQLGRNLGVLLGLRWPDSAATVTDQSLAATPAPAPGQHPATESPSPSSAPPQAVWCVVANVVRERAAGEGGRERRRGTKHFAPGAKVYCFPPLWGDGYERIRVVGRHRATHRYVTMVIRSEWLTGWRVELVYSPHVIRRLAGHWDGGAESKAQAEELVRWVPERWRPRPAAQPEPHGSASQSPAERVRESERGVFTMFTAFLQRRLGSEEFAEWLYQSDDLGPVVGREWENRLLALDYLAPGAAARLDDLLLGFYHEARPWEAQLEHARRLLCAVAGGTSQELIAACNELASAYELGGWDSLAPFYTLSNLFWTNLSSSATEATGYRRIVTDEDEQLDWFREAQRDAQQAARAVLSRHFPGSHCP